MFVCLHGNRKNSADNHFKAIIINALPCKGETAFGAAAGRTAALSACLLPAINTFAAEAIVIKIVALFTYHTQAVAVAEAVADSRRAGRIVATNIATCHN